MDKVILSVIIPVYNSEKYIKKCIESVIINTDKRIECIVVDDGSTDNSLKISRSIEEIDSRVRVFTKSNGGVSSARNLGLQKSRGKYITFIDADDYFYSEWDKFVLEEISKENKAELIVYNYSMLYNDGIIKNIDNGLNKGCLFELKEFDKKLFTTFIMNACWGKIYLREIIFKNNIKFDITLKIGEDAKFVLDYRRNIKRVYVSRNSILVKLDNLNSTMYVTDYYKNIEDNYSIFLLRKKYSKEFAPIYLNKINDEYLKTITGIMRTVAYQKTIKETKIIYKNIISSKYFEVMNRMSTKNLGLLKKFEFKILKTNTTILAIYFKLKGKIYFRLKKAKKID